jgi:hypothetical protein
VACPPGLKSGAAPVDPPQGLDFRQGVFFLQMLERYALSIPAVYLTLMYLTLVSQD